MPRLTCLCGYNVDLSQIPNPQGFKIISEPALEILTEKLAEAHRDAGSEADFERRMFSCLRDRSLSILQAYECPNCRRIAVFRHASDSVPWVWLKPEGSEAESFRGLAAVGS